MLCAVLLSAGCNQSPRINEMARQEADATIDDALASYNKAQRIISLENNYSWEMTVEVNDQPTQNAKFAYAAGELETARDKFLQASAKMREALNGQKAFDNELATRLSRMSEAYQRWSELAEFERRNWQEASGLTDSGALREKLTEAQKKQQKMSEELMSMMRGIS